MHADTPNRILAPMNEPNATGNVAAGIAPTAPERALGIDIGGTGIKAAIVDLASGQLVTERIRELTPQPAIPEAVVDVVVHVVQRVEATGQLTPNMPGGAGFPSVIKDGRPMTAANLDHSWIGAPARELLARRLDRPMYVLNEIGR